jgi:hypothetical protein
MSEDAIIDQELTVGQVADRSGVAVSALHLSLKLCKLMNPYDVLGHEGPGPRNL